MFSGKPRFNQAALDDLPFEAGGLACSQFPQPSKEDSIAIFEARNIEFLAQAGVYVMPESIIRNSKWP